MSSESSRKFPVVNRLRWAVKNNLRGPVLWLRAEDKSDEHDPVLINIRNLVGSEYFLLIDDEISCCVYLDQHTDHYFLIVSSTASELLRQRANHVHNVNDQDEDILYHKLLKETKAIDYNEENAMHMRIQTVQDIQTEQLALNAHAIDAKAETNPTTVIVPKEVRDTKRQQQRRFMFDFSGESAGFTEYQLLIECLIQTNDLKASLADMVLFCRARTTDPTDLAAIDEFEQTYRSEEALWWYSRDSCIYKQLNRVLLDGDIHALFACRLLIGDIHRQLCQMYSQQDLPNPLIVYRGRRMPQDQIKGLQSLVDGGLACMTSFNSTSVNRNVAETFAGSDTNSVIFEICIDSNKLNKPLADISTRSQFQDEQEILLFAGIIFRVVTVEYDEHRAQPWLVKLELADETEEFKRAVSIMRTLCENGMHSYAYMLHYFGRQTEADFYWRRLLDSGQQDDLQIGRIHRFLREYDLAIEHLENVLANKRYSCDDRLRLYDELAICQRESDRKQSAMHTYGKMLELLDPEKDRDRIATIYHDMSYVVTSSDPKAAINLCQRALELVQDKENDFVAYLYTSIGVLYVILGELEKGLISFMYAYQILEHKEKTIGNECELAVLDSYISSILLELGNIDEAYRKAQHSVTLLHAYLPKTHGNTSYSLKIIGDIYLAREDYTTALDYYQKILDSGSISIPGLLHCNIARAYVGLNKIPQAEEHYRLAVDCSRESKELPTVYRMFSKFYEEQGRFDLALDQRELSLEAEYKFLGHASRAYHTALASCFSRQGNYAKAVEHAECDIKLLDAEPDSDRILSFWIRLSAAAHHRRNGQLDQALERTTEALRLIGSLDEQENDELVAGFCNTYAFILFDRGSFTEAMNWVCRAIEANLSNVNYLVLSHYILALIYNAQQKYELGLIECQRALCLKIPVNLAADPFPVRARIYELIADIYIEQNRFEEARHMLELVDFIRHNLYYPSHHPDHARTQRAFACLSIKQNKIKDAHEHIQKAISIQEISLHNTHYELGHSYALLAECVPDRAVEYLNRAAYIYTQSLPNTHPNVVAVQQKLSKLEQHSYLWL